MMIEGATIATILQILPIIGLGSLITLLAQNWLKKRERTSDRVYEEKREAFVGLLKSVGEYVATGTDEHRMSLAYWRMRCELVASQSTRAAINHRFDHTQIEAQAHEAMLSEMRKELGISK